MIQQLQSELCEGRELDILKRNKKMGPHPKVQMSNYCRIINGQEVDRIQISITEQKNIHAHHRKEYYSAIKLDEVLTHILT